MEKTARWIAQSAFCATASTNWHVDLEELAPGIGDSQRVGHAGWDGDGVARTESLDRLIRPLQRQLAGEHEPELQRAIVRL